MKTRCIYRLLLFCTVLLGPGLSTSVSAELDVKAARALIRRVVPGHARYFEVEYIPRDEGRDVFELEQDGQRIVLRGNNGVSVASALNHYLKHYAHCDISWNGTNLDIPTPMPEVAQKVRITTPYRYRHYFNYCTFNYTASWWDWDRWQWEIDFMALNGINMPLALTGQNSIWDKVYRSLGFTKEELDSFFSGPAYFTWFWMGNLDGWGGPLPERFMAFQEELQKKILARERELGMTPILPSFTGHVPPSFRKRFPEAKVHSTQWGINTNVAPPVYILDPSEPLFAEIGKRFLGELIATYGTDHLYSADTFNEMLPPREDPEYLNAIASKVYGSMSEVDDRAVWVMQGWMFLDRPGFWQPAQMQAMFDAVPDGRLIVLDLDSEVNPVWSRTDAFYGEQWIWNMLHNFGGRISLYGKMDEIARGPAEALHHPGSGNMVGIGLTMEAIEQNPVVYQMMLEHVWSDERIDPEDYIEGYITRRYGKKNAAASKAWNILLNTVYRSNKKDQGPAESMITGRPTFNENSAWTWTDLVYYDNKDFVPAWTLMLEASDSLSSSNGFRYDLVDVTRQALANYGTALHRQIAYTYYAGDLETYRLLYRRFLDLISDMDRLLGTRQEFLLGKWVEDAGKWAENEDERILYRRNARNLVSVWGRKDVADISDYSCRHWNGLMESYYKGRWEEFFRMTDAALEEGRDWDEKAFYDYIRDWGWQWVNNDGLDFISEPEGDPVEVCKELYAKYYDIISRSEVTKQLKNELE